MLGIGYLKEKQRKLEHKSSGYHEVSYFALWEEEERRGEEKGKKKRVRGLLMASAQKRKGPAGSPELSGPTRLANGTSGVNCFFLFFLFVFFIFVLFHVFFFFFPLSFLLFFLISLHLLVF